MAKTTLNRRLLVGSLLTLALAGGAVYGLHSYQVEQHSDFFLQQARDAVARGDDVAAADFYRKANDLEPNRFESLSETAQTLERLGSFVAAYGIAQRAQRLDASDRDNATRLARLAIQLGRYGDARSRVAELLKQPQDDLATLLSLQGDALSGDLEKQAAIESYQQAIQTGKAAKETYSRLADVITAQSRRNLPEAMEVLDQMVAAFPDDPDALLIRGSWYLDQTQGRLPSSTDDLDGRLSEYLNKANADAQAARAVSDDSVESLRFAALVSSRLESHRQTLQIATEAIERFPQVADFYRYAAISVDQLRAASQGVSDASQADLAASDAEAYLRKGIANASETSELVWDMANRQLADGRLDDVQDSIEQLRGLSFPAASMEYLQARLMAAQGQTYEADQLLQAVRSKVVEQPEFTRLIDLSLAEIYGKLGDVDRQIAVLRRVITLDPTWLVAREQLAIAYLQGGRIEEAVNEYQSISMRPDIPITAPLNLAKLLLLRNLNVESEQRDWRSVDQILQVVEAQRADDPEAAVLRAEIALANNDLQKARDILAAAKAVPRVWSARILLEAAQKDYPTSEKLVAEALRSVGDIPEIRYAAALISVYQSDERTAGRLRKLSEVPQEWSDDQRDTLAGVLVPLLITAEQWSAAENLARSVADSQPDDAKSRLQLLDIYYRTGQSDRMGEILASLKSLTGENAMWHYGMALQIASSRRGAQPTTQVDSPAASQSDDRSTEAAGKLTAAENDLAQKHLAEAAALRPDWANVPALSATLFEQLENPGPEAVESSITKYLQAIELGWRQPATVRRVVQLLTARQRFGEADTVIRKLSTGDQPFSAEMSRIASEVSVQMADMRRAIALAGRAAEASKDPADYLWWGSLLEISQNSAEAEAVYQAALKLAPDHEEIRVAWIGFLERNNRLADARDAIADFESKVASSGSSTGLAVAECYLRIDEIEDARRTLAAVSSESFQSAEQFQRLHTVFAAINPAEQSHQQLRSWIDDPKTPEAGRQWSRRQLALEIASNSDPEKFSEAKSLIDQNLQDDPQSIPDRRVLANLNATYLGGVQPRAALDIYESLVSDGWIPSIDDEFVIGQLYALAGDWTQGRRRLLQLLSNDQIRKPYHLRTYAGLLLARGDAREAELWLDQLIRGGDRDPATANLLAELRFQRRQFDQLLADLTVAPVDAPKVTDPEVAWFLASTDFKNRYQLLVGLTTRLESIVNDPRPDAAGSTEDAGTQPAASTSVADPAVQPGDREALTRMLAAADVMAEQLQQQHEFPGAFYAIQLLRRGQCERAVAAIADVAGEATKEDLVQFAELALTLPQCSGEPTKRLENVFSKVASDRPDEPTFEVIRARLSEARGDYKAAITAYRRLIAKDPQNTVAMNNLATLLALTKQDAAEAIALCDRAIELGGETMVYLDTRGVSKLNAGDLEGALEDLGRGLAMVPHPVIRFHIAWVYDLQNDPQRSQAEMAAALAAGLTESMLHPLEAAIFRRLRGQRS